VCIIWCEVHFDIWNRFGVTDDCDRQTDRLYDRKGGASLRYAAKTCSTVIGLMPFRGLCLMRVRHV